MEGSWNKGGAYLVFRERITPLRIRFRLIEGETMFPTHPLTLFRIRNERQDKVKALVTACSREIPNTRTSFLPSTLGLYHAQFGYNI